MSPSPFSFPFLLACFLVQIPGSKPPPTRHRLNQAPFYTPACPSQTTTLTKSRVAANFNHFVPTRSSLLMDPLTKPLLYHTQRLCLIRASGTTPAKRCQISEMSSPAPTLAPLDTACASAAGAHRHRPSSINSRHFADSPGYHLTMPSLHLLHQQRSPPTYQLTK